MSYSFTKQLGISVLISYSLSISVWYLYCYYIKHKTNKIPRKWKRVGFVEKIILYPLKSGALREVNTAECTELGLREVEKNSSIQPKYLFQDRSFVSYDVKNNKSLHLCKHPTVTLITVDSVDSDTLIFKAPGIENLTFKLSTIIKARNRVKVDIYGVKCDAVDCGDEACEWLSTYLNSREKNYRLGYYAERVIKRPDPIGTTLQVEGFSKLYQHWRKNDGGAYSDLTSYMIVTTSSIDDLNDKLQPEDKFFYGNLRPNIVVRGCEKYAEDAWKWIKIGENIVMRTIKPCTRCAITAINPITGQRNKNMEPLKTLKSYRSIKLLTGQKLQGDRGVLGINVGLYAPGEIHIDDPVYIDA